MNLLYSFLIKLICPFLPNIGSNNVKVKSRDKYKTKKTKNVIFITLFLLIVGVLHNIRLPIYANTQNIPSKNNLPSGLNKIRGKISASIYTTMLMVAIK